MKFTLLIINQTSLLQLLNRNESTWRFELTNKSLSSDSFAFLFKSLSYSVQIALCCFLEDEVWAHKTNLFTVGKVSWKARFLLPEHFTYSSQQKRKQVDYITFISNLLSENCCTIENFLSLKNFWKICLLNVSFSLCKRVPGGGNDELRSLKASRHVTVRKQMCICEDKSFTWKFKRRKVGDDFPSTLSVARHNFALLIRRSWKLNH